MSIAKQLGFTFSMVDIGGGLRLAPSITCSVDANGNRVNEGIAEYLEHTGPIGAQELIDQLIEFPTESDPADSILDMYPIFATEDFTFWVNQNTNYPNTSIEAFYATFAHTSGGDKNNISFQDLILLLGEWRDFLNSYGSKHNLASM